MYNNLIGLLQQAYIQNQAELSVIKSRATTVPYPTDSDRRAALEMDIAVLQATIQAVVSMSDRLEKAETDIKQLLLQIKGSA